MAHYTLLNMFDFRKFSRSFGFAFQGLRWLMQENNAKVHLSAMIWAVGMGFYFCINTWEWMAVSLAITLVWICEAFNTALEKLVDLASPEHHPLAGKAKDLAASAVLVAAIFAVVVAVVVFGKYLF